MSTLLIFFNLIFATVRISSESCRVEYSRKGCTTLTVEGVVVMCDGGNKATNFLPNTIPLDVVYLSLKNYNFIQNWDKGHFGKFVKLQCLFVTHTHILGINEDVFLGSSSLKEVTFKNINKFSESSLRFIHNIHSPIEHLAIINTRHFAELTTKINGDNNYISKNLKSLILKGNSLKSFPESFFTSFRYLETLDLSDNSIKNLNWTHMVTSLKSLNELRLNGNAFQIIPESALPLFLMVNKLYLGSNKFHCNCYLRWLKEFYEINSDHKNLDEDQIHCHNHNKKVSLKEIPNDMFLCQKPSTPVISWRQRDDDDNVEFNCSSRGDPPPDVLIYLQTPTASREHGELLEDDLFKRVIIPAVDDSFMLETMSPNILVGPSLVRCVAENNVGTASHQTFIGTLKNLAKLQTHPRLPMLLAIFHIIVFFTNFNP